MAALKVLIVVVATCAVTIATTDSKSLLAEVSRLERDVRALEDNPGTPEPECFNTNNGLADLIGATLQAKAADEKAGHQNVQGITGGLTVWYQKHINENGDILCSDDTSKIKCRGEPFGKQVKTIRGNTYCCVPMIIEDILKGEDFSKEENDYRQLVERQMPFYMMGTKFQDRTTPTTRTTGKTFGTACGYMKPPSSKSVGGMGGLCSAYRLKELCVWHGRDSDLPATLKTACENLEAKECGLDLGGPSGDEPEDEDEP